MEYRAFIRGNKGMTLIELLVVLVIVSVLISALYRTFIKQQETYIIQEQVVDVQQNLRMAMDLIVRYLRMAGYDPKGTGNFGFQITASDGRSTGPTSIAFTIDYNENGSVDNDDHEQVAFRLNGLELQKYSVSSNNHWQSLAENIEKLSFTYIMADGTVTNFPVNPKDIRLVRVTLIGRTGMSDSGFSSDGYRRRELTNIIKVRNLGL